LQGAEAAFGVSLNGTAPFAYRWFFNGTPILNSGYGIYVIYPATNNAGNYSVIITNSAGSITSNVASLTVLLSPTNRVTAVNGTATFNVVAFNPVSLAYGWQRNNTYLNDGGKYSGVSGSTLTITDVSSNEAALYSVIVYKTYNPAISATTSNATLTVLVSPSLALQFAAGYPQLNLTGMLSNNFVVQYNTDLTTTNWITLLSLSNLLTSPYLFQDPAGVVPPARFYRVLMQ
jgi:hypothetical protein